MAEIVIKGTAYPLKFGMGLLREIDTRYKRPIEPNIDKNVGFQYTVASLMDGSSVALEDILLTANKTEKPRLTQAVLDEYLEDKETDLQALQAEVIGFLDDSNVCALQMKILRTLLTQAQALA